MSLLPFFTLVWFIFVALYATGLAICDILPDAQKTKLLVII